MFDVSFSELMLIGVIALIVIGPERLPKVARTVGHLLGRAQRYVNEVKSDIQKEMDLKEIGDLKNQMEDAARSVQSSMTSSVEDLKAAVTQPTQALKDSLEEARKALDPAAAAAPTTSAEPSPAALAAPESILAQGAPTPSEDAAVPVMPTPPLEVPARPAAAPTASATEPRP